MTEITDKSLLRCTVKKSAHVLWKAAIVALAIAVAYAIYTIAASALPVIITAITNWDLPRVVFASVLVLLTSIPWYYYAGAAAIGAIPAYSFLWCVSRDLTDDDWESKSANEFALALVAIAALAIAALVALVAIAALATITALVALVAITTLVALVAIATLVALATITALAVDPVSEITIWYYIFRFPGAAWHHYTKEI